MKGICWLALFLFSCSLLLTVEAAPGAPESRSGRGGGSDSSSEQQRRSPRLVRTTLSGERLPTQSGSEDEDEEQEEEEEDEEQEEEQDEEQEDAEGKDDEDQEEGKEDEEDEEEPKKKEVSCSRSSSRHSVALCSSTSQQFLWYGACAVLRNRGEAGGGPCEEGERGRRWRGGGAAR